MPKIKTIEQGMKVLSKFSPIPNRILDLEVDGQGWWSLQYNGSGYWFVLPQWTVRIKNKYIIQGNCIGTGKTALVAIKRAVREVKK